ncbi:MAG: Gfo/Idh/MocA family oxidoreductase [Bacteroidales bacterium]|nr:Gfo/Idh/MocA family oxidoreductase [Bacteroidales bacterium]
MLRIGIIGSTQNILPYISCLSDFPEIQIAGYFDPLGGNGSQTVELDQFGSLEKVFYQSDAIILVHKGSLLADLAKRAVKSSKHVFIDNPSAIQVKKIYQLIQLANEANTILKVKQTGRRNSIITKLKDQLLFSRYVEVRNNLNYYSIRQNSLLESMVDDIDIIIGITSNIKKIKSANVWFTDTDTQLINARIEFDNQLIVNLTWNTLSDKKSHNAIFAQPDKYINIDLSNQEAEIISLKGAKFSEKFEERQLTVEKVIASKNQPLNEELTRFTDLIKNNSKTLLNSEEEFKPYLVAYDLLSKVKGGIFI